jgi:hypothetical protein
MAVPAGLSKILTKTAPERLTDISEKVLNILSKTNEIVRKINEVDFCNPLGYILTKALPPGGVLEVKLIQYGKDIVDFIDKTENKLDPFKRKGETEEAYQTRLKSYQVLIEEIRVALVDIIPPPELVDIMPGGTGLLKTINSLNLVLTVTSDTVDARTDNKQLIINQISFLKAFTSKLKPFTSPINIATLAIGDQAEELNKKLRDFIKPERFASDLQKLINGVKAVDRAIQQIQKTIQLINTIIKVINVLIKIYKFIVKLITFNPIPTAIIPPQTGGLGVPQAVLNKQSERISNSNIFIEDLAKVLGMISEFLDKNVLLEINKIRKQILRLLTGLNLLYKNIIACPYINDDLMKQSLQDGISSLQENLNTLDNLFPGAKNIDVVLPSQYSGYQIDIIKEEVVDNGTTLLRRRVVVADQRGIIQYEGTPTFATNDQVLIKEGQYYIDKQFQRSTSAQGNDNTTDQEVIDIVTQIGLDPNNTIVGPVTPN